MLTVVGRREGLQGVMAEARGREIDNQQATKLMVIYLIFLFFGLHSFFLGKDLQNSG